jgi:hypothetical protein
LSSADLATARVFAVSERLDQPPTRYFTSFALRWSVLMMPCLGLDYERLTFKFQGRDFRLTDVHREVVKRLLA